MSMAGRLSTADAAAQAGIALITLQRWIRAGKIDAPKIVVRHGRATRLWSSANVKKLRQIKKHLYHQGGGRKKKAPK
ncbi:MAG: MerR family transcriptional regulator [Terriglobia bacterium]